MDVLYLWLKRILCFGSVCVLFWFCHYRDKEGPNFRKYAVIHFKGWLVFYTIIMLILYFVEDAAKMLWR